MQGHFIYHPGMKYDICIYCRLRKKIKFYFIHISNKRRKLIFVLIGFTQLNEK